MADSLSLFRGRVRLAVALAVAIVAVAVPSAQASLLPGLLPGVLAPAGTTGSCTSSSPVFSQFGDSSNYMLIPGGSFEAGTQAWQLSGAYVASGNEPFYVTSPTDSRSLVVPAGASATTPPMCYDNGDPHLRFVLKSRSNGYGYVKVSIVMRSLVTGLLQGVLDGGTVRAGGTWQLSDEVALPISNLTGLLTTDSITLKLTAVGGSFQVDDAYLDPFASY